MDTKHSPFPWHRDLDHERASPANIGNIYDAEDNIVATVAPHERMDANAAVIVAAPKLAGACRAVVDSWIRGDLAAAARDCEAALRDAGLMD